MRQTVGTPMCMSIRRTRCSSRSRTSWSSTPRGEATQGAGLITLASPTAKSKKRVRKYSSMPAATSDQERNSPTITIYNSVSRIHGRRNAPMPASAARAVVEAPCWAKKFSLGITAPIKNSVPENNRNPSAFFLYRAQCA
jgi:hypothetical protein